MVHDHERALELAQDALLSAYRRLDSFGGRASFSSWLFAITRNRCLSVLRRPALLEEEGVEPEDIGSSGVSPDRVLEEKEGEERILGLIRRHLGAQEQEVLWLRCIERLPVDEITRVMGISSASGARGVLQTARRKLRSALAEQSRLEGEGNYG
jgi:RNA polymerase sigma-70 factor (ECF subfamily)